MSDSEERLYYNCMSFCEVFFKVLCEKEKLQWGYDDYTRNRILQFNKELLESKYNNLFDAIEEMENDRKGVVGQRKYRLVLERIDKDVEK